MSNITKPKVLVKKIKHTFNPEEVAGLNVEFGQAFDNVQAVNQDADAQKAVLKAKITEAESRMTTLRATINAGFEMRDKRCVVVLDMKQNKKLFFIESEYNDAIEKDGEGAWKDLLPVQVETMTDEDLQQELIEAEAKFEAREEITLFAPVGESSGTLAVGRLKGKWFGALRVNIPGKLKLEERLDGEQPCNKQRADQVRRSCKRFRELLVENLGKDEASGFYEALDRVVEEHKEREE